MGIFTGLFKSRDKPQNRTAGSSYTFFMGGSTSGKAVTERSAMVSRSRLLLRQLRISGNTVSMVAVAIRIFISSIKEQPLVLETWDEGLWIELLDCGTVYADNRIVFRFKDGTEIEVGIS